MALITLRQLLDHAAENQYGVPAFNINNMEQGLAILKAADKTDSPVILQASSCLLYTSPSPRDLSTYRLASSA